jgi:hypothetical protein
MEMTMSKTALLLMLVAGSLVLTATVATAQPAAQCLRQDMVNGWKVVNDQTLIVTDRVGKQYTVSLAKGCHDLSWPSAMGFTSASGAGLSCIGRNDFLTVPGDQVNVSQRCLIDNVQPAR